MTDANRQRLNRVREVLREMGPETVCKQAQERLAAEGILLAEMQFYSQYRRVFGYSRTQLNGKGVMLDETVQSLRGVPPGDGVPRENNVTEGAGEGRGHVPTDAPAFVTPAAPSPSDPLDELIEIRDFCNKHGGVARTAMLVNTLKVLTEGFR